MEPNIPINIGTESLKRSGRHTLFDRGIFGKRRKNQGLYGNGQSFGKVGVFRGTKRREDLCV